MSATLEAPAALSPAGGGAHALATVKQIVLDAISSPLARTIYARALEHFCLLGGAPPAGNYPRDGEAWRAALEAKGLAPASIHQKLSAVRKLAVGAS